MSLVLSPATTLDTYLFDLRGSDLLEASKWAPGVDPYQSLRTAIRVSKVAIKGTAGDDVVGVWGFTEDSSGIHPWLMCSDLIEKHRKDFLRFAREAVQKVLSDHPGRLVGNYVYRYNQQAKSLLAHLGFLIVPSPGAGDFDFFYHPQSCASPQQS